MSTYNISGPLERSRSTATYNTGSIPYPSTVPGPTYYEPNLTVKPPPRQPTINRSYPISIDEKGLGQSYMVSESLPSPPPPPPPMKSAALLPGQGAGSGTGMVTIPADMFDRMFLDAQKDPSPSTARASSVGNPTPLSIIGFLLSLSPLSAALMGWRGAGGNGAATIGTYFFIGGLLMFTGGLLEYHAGATFPFVVFCSFGGFWFAYGATLLPFFNAFGAYSPDPTSLAAGLATKGFNATFGFFMLFMALLCLIYLVCSLRTNLAFLTIFLGLFAGFVFLTVTFFLVADASSAAGRMLYLGGASFFVSCAAGWYIFTAFMLSSVDFPFSLPVGDLSRFVKGASQR